MPHGLNPRPSRLSRDFLAQDMTSNRERYSALSILRVFLGYKFANPLLESAREIQDPSLGLYNLHYPEGRLGVSPGRVNKDLEKTFPLRPFCRAGLPSVSWRAFPLLSVSLLPAQSLPITGWKGEGPSVLLPQKL